LFSHASTPPIFFFIYNFKIFYFYFMKGIFVTGRTLILFGSLGKDIDIIDSLGGTLTIE
jgi:hypothetical protein